MFEIILFFLVFIILISMVIIISKYNLIGNKEGVYKLYEYSKYLIINMKDKDMTNEDFKNHIKDSKNIFYVIYTNSRIIKAEHIKYNEEKIDKVYNELINSLKTKELSISFFDLNNAESYEKLFFYFILKYQYFNFTKYLTKANVIFFFALISTTLVVLFNILVQKTLYILGIPLQLSLISTYEFAKLISSEMIITLFVFIIATTFIILVSFTIISLGILLFRCNIEDKLRDITGLLSMEFFVLIVIFAFLISILVILITVSLVKIKFPNSIVGYDKIITTIGDYIDYTGYPKVANINGNKSYIVSDKDNIIYYYDIRKVKDKFFTFDKQSEKLYDTCKSIFKYEDDNARLYIVLLNNGYLKAKYIDSKEKTQLNIKDNKLLEYEDIIVSDIDNKCKIYIKEYNKLPK
ncbi:hypothetical protein ACN2EN_00130 [Aliarcobacter lanthieri]|uniref:hypothetical protein n=2 Tax=Aliarcobacter lanthieri TaxID=1355374 RepID=UPI003AFB70DB